MMTPMEVSVRPARATDDVAGLLYESAAPYYDAYMGSRVRAVRVLGAVYPRRRHTASWEVCGVAERLGEVVGIFAAFPISDAEALARRFIGLTVPRLPAYRWPLVLRHLRASARVTPVPPLGALYVDALAVVEGSRRAGVAGALLEEAERLAREAGLERVALDTGIENEAAQALYEAAGFERTGETRAVNARIAEAVGGAGFVSYVRELR